MSGQSPHSEQSHSSNAVSVLKPSRVPVWCLGSGRRQCETEDRERERRKEGFVLYAENIPSGDPCEALRNKLKVHKLRQGNHFRSPRELIRVGAQRAEEGPQGERCEGMDIGSLDGSPRANGCGALGQGGPVSYSADIPAAMAAGPLRDWKSRSTLNTPSVFFMRPALNNRGAQNWELRPDPG